MNLSDVPRPALRYFGGKWRLAPWVISHFPSHRIYCEPFGGGASVLLRKPRSFGEVYNDLDESIVNVFRVLRSSGGELQRLLELTPFARGEFEESYLKSTDPVENARRTIALSFMGFGSDSITRGTRTGFRNNSNRSGTTPATDFSRYSRCIPFFIERLRGVVIENRSAETVMASQDSPETLHYVDPPYVHSKRSDETAGYRYELSDSDHADLCVFLSNLRGMVVLSGYQNDIYRSLERSGWKRRDRASLVFGNKERTESVWLNPAASSRLVQGELFDAPPAEPGAL